MGASHNPVILTYHSISYGDSPLKISPELFAAQMKWLRDNARVVPLGEIVAALASHAPLPERTVALTFDDGFQDFYLSAAPLLHRWALPATVFLATGYCGRTNSWPGQPDWVDQQPLLSWEQVAELARQGFSFGAHSVSHPVLTRLPVVEAQQEIIQCKSQIEERVGQPVEFFCYPYGRWNPAVRTCSPSPAPMPTIYAPGGCSGRFSQRAFWPIWRLDASSGGSAESPRGVPIPSGRIMRPSAAMQKQRTKQ